MTTKTMPADQALFMDVCGQKRATLLETIGALSTRDQQFLNELAMHWSLVDEEVNREMRTVWFDQILNPIPGKVLGKSDLEIKGETIDAIVEFVDGAIDSLYVIISMLNKMGVPVQECWDEVQRSNMEKAAQCPACGGTGSKDIATPCSECNSKGWQVQRRADGKILKPDGWQPPNLRNILLKAMSDEISAKIRKQAVQQIDRTGGGYDTK